MWIATIGDSADLADCHFISCSNSAGLFFSSFCSKPVPVTAVFFNTAGLFYCVLLSGLNETHLGFVFVALVRC